LKSERDESWSRLLGFGRLLLLLIDANVLAVWSTNQSRIGTRHSLCFCGDSVPLFVTVTEVGDVVPERFASPITVILRPSEIVGSSLWLSSSPPPREMKERRNAEEGRSIIATKQDILERSSV
jgi:hypothetical protein